MTAKITAYKLLQDMPTTLAQPDCLQTRLLSSSIFERGSVTQVNACVPGMLAAQSRKQLARQQGYLGSQADHKHHPAAACSTGRATLNAAFLPEPLDHKVSQQQAQGQPQYTAVLMRVSAVAVLLLVGLADLARVSTARTHPSEEHAVKQLVHKARGAYKNTEPIIGVLTQPCSDCPGKCVP
jgi:hypothetical protein